MRAPIGNGGGGGLGLAIEPTGQLDRAYPDIDLADAAALQVEIIWSSGELQEGERLTVTSRGVIRGADAYAPTEPGGTACRPWSHPLE